MTRSGAESDAELVQWLSALRTLSAAATAEADPLEVLNLVAATAQTLLKFDFCGVLIPDPARESLVITVSGLSAEYVHRVNSERPVRLDSTAPSSRAYHRGSPVAVTDIAAEAGFAPWGEAGREQGYQAMVAVPLIAGTEVLGTLNGYYRTTHVFGPDEIERLTLLANHAAIALTSARLLDELRALTASLREQRDALTRSEHIHQRLLAVTLRSGGFGGIATVLAELVGRPVLIDDARHDQLATSGSRAALPDTEARSAARFADDASSAPLRTGSGDATFLVSTARLGGEVAARIWLPDLPDPLDPIGVRAVEHASIVVALEVLRVRTGIDAEHRLRGDLVVELLTSTGPLAGQLLSRAELLGHDLERRHTMLVGALGAAAERSYQRASTVVSDALRAYRPRPLAAMYRGDVVVLWPADAGATVDAAALMQRTIAALPGGEAATVVLAPPADSDPPSYANVYRITKGALDIAVRAGQTGTVLQLADLGIAGLLLQLDDTAQLLGFVDRALGPLVRYDSRHRTQLLDTLRTYLDCKLDRGRTAAAMHIHPNTVGQRLRRIEALCSVDLTDPAVAAHLSAALTVRGVALSGR